MPNFNRLATITLSLDVDDTITFNGKASFTVTPSGGTTQYGNIDGTRQTLGPFGASVTLVITCETAGSYTVNSTSVQVLAKTKNNLLTALVNPDGSESTLGYGTADTLRIVQPTHLRRWAKALADAAYTPVNVWNVGDSKTFGVGADNVFPAYPPTISSIPTDAIGDANGFAGRLRDLFQNKFYPYTPNKAGFIHAQQDAAVATAGATTTRSINGYARAINTSGPGVLTFSIPASTRIQIITWENDGADGDTATGAFTYNIDGAGAVSVPNSGLVKSYRVINVTGLSNAPHTVVLTGTTTAFAVICGIGYDSGAGVKVGRFGRPDWTTADAIGNGSNSGVLAAAVQASRIKAFSMGSPALVIMEFMTNDYKRGSLAQSTLSKFESDTRLLCAEVVASGGCVLLVQSGSRDPAVVDAQVGPNSMDDYRAVYEKIANDTDHVSSVSVVDLFGTWQNEFDNGLYTDSSHESRYGYGLKAQAIFNSISSPKLLA